jgi:hypothetical protein
MMANGVTSSGFVYDVRLYGDGVPGTCWRLRDGQCAVCEHVCYLCLSLMLGTEMATSARFSIGDTRINVVVEYLSLPRIIENMWLIASTKI